MRSDSDRPIGPDDRIDPANAAAAAPALRWRLMLVWFMRMLAVIWCAKGVLWWTELLGMQGGPSFEDRRLAARAVLVGFSVIDLVAAVGLWLTSVWGGLMWLLSVTTELILSVATPGLVTPGLAAQAMYVVSIVVYLVLTAMAAREEEPD